jgi:hypothetical protein
MARKPAPPKRVSRITIPTRCNPLAKLIFAEMQRQSVTYDELEYRSGVLRSTFKAWRGDNRPGLDTIEATLGALGWLLLPVPVFEQVPEDIRADLMAIADRWQGINPTLCQLLATVSTVPILHPSGAPGERPTPNRKARRRARRLWSHPDQTALFDDVAA